MELTFDYDMTTSTGSIDSLRLLEWSLMYYAVERIGLHRCRRLPEPWTIVGVSSRRLDVVDTSFDVNGSGGGGKSDDDNNDSIHDYNNHNDKHISRGYTHFLYTTLTLSHTHISYGENAGTACIRDEGCIPIHGWMQVVVDEVENNPRWSPLPIAPFD
jgi:hypothetical protein